MSKSHRRIQKGTFNHTNERSLRSRQVLHRQNEEQTNSSSLSSDISDDERDSPKLMSNICHSLGLWFKKCSCADNLRNSQRSKSSRRDRNCYVQRKRFDGEIRNTESRFKNHQIKQQRLYKSGSESSGGESLLDSFNNNRNLIYQDEDRELEWDSRDDFPIIAPMPLKKKSIKKSPTIVERETQSSLSMNPNAKKPPLPPSAIARRKFLQEQLQEKRQQQLWPLKHSKSSTFSSNTLTSHSKTNSGKDFNNSSPRNSLTIIPTPTNQCVRGGYLEQYRRQLEDSNSAEPLSSILNKANENDKFKELASSFALLHKEVNDLEFEDIMGLKVGRQHEFGDVHSSYFDGKNKTFSNSTFEAVVDESCKLVESWGAVKSLYIRINADGTPNTQGPIPQGFSRKEIQFDQTRIELRASRAKSNLEYLRESSLDFRQMKRLHWKRRRQIGLFKRSLEADKSIPKLIITDELESHFHHIHWFSEVNDRLNYVGRYFDMKENRLVAIKIFGSGFCMSEAERLGNKLSAMVEISSLLKLDHTNIVKLLTYFELNAKVYLVMEPCNHTLREEIEKASKGFHPKMAASVMLQIVNGLEYCHDLNILHRDLTPDNILVTSDGILKLSDFNRSIQLGNELFTKLIEVSLSTNVGPGSITYGAPELLQQLIYYRSTENDSEVNIGSISFTLASDIWSIGCICAEMLKGIPIWNCSKDSDQLYEIQKIFTNLTLPEFPGVFKSTTSSQDKSEEALREKLPKVSEDALSFVIKCLEIDPRKRSTCHSLLEHPFLKLARDEVEAQPMALPFLPKMENLWKDFRPHTAPMISTSSLSEINILPHFYHQSHHQILNQVESNNDIQSISSNYEIGELDTNYECEEYCEEDDEAFDCPLELSTSVTSVVYDDGDERNVEGMDRNEMNPDNHKHKFTARKKVRKPTSTESIAGSLPPNVQEFDDPDDNYDGYISGNNDPELESSITNDWNHRSKHYYRKNKGSAKKINNSFQHNDDNGQNRQQYHQDPTCPSNSKIKQGKHLTPSESMYEMSEHQSQSRNHSKREENSSTYRKKKHKIIKFNSGFEIPLSVSASAMCAAHSKSEIVGSIKKAPKEVMREIMSSLHDLTWTMAETYTTQIKQMVRSSPRLIAESIPLLVTRLLELIAISKSRVAGPAIKVLNHLYDIVPKSMDEQCDNVVAGMLGKLGGPLFIDTECMEILRQVVTHTEPIRACMALTKYGIGHRMGVSRSAAAKLLCSTIKKLNIKEDIGDQTHAKRRLTSSLFEAATRFTQDSNVGTRDSGREIFGLLLPNLDFWRLYMTLVPDDQRMRTNRLLDEIRRVQK